MDSQPAYQPQVSVVIPTRGRPELVPRAVRSALGQTLTDLEVIVVVDGPDEVTRPALADQLTDDRLRLVELPASGGAPAARNVGVTHARGRYLALLDDDDEWLPEKLATQVALAEGAAVALPVVASRLRVRTPRGEFELPRRLPAGEPTSEYLTVRRGLFHGDGFIQTSTILAPTELLRRVPFDPAVRRFQELDWTLRSLAVDGVGLVYAEQALTIWYADENRARISFDIPWRTVLAWLDSSRPRLTRRAYAALALSSVSSVAVASHSPRVFLKLLWNAHRYGRPGLLDYVTHAQIWAIPPGLRRTLRDKVLTRRRGASGAPEPARIPAQVTATTAVDAQSRVAS